MTFDVTGGLALTISLIFHDTFDWYAASAYMVVVLCHVVIVILHFILKRKHRLESYEINMNTATTDNSTTSLPLDSQTPVPTVNTQTSTTSGWKSAAVDIENFEASTDRLNPSSPVTENDQ